MNEKERSVSVGQSRVHVVRRVGEMLRMHIESFTFGTSLHCTSVAVAI